MRNLLNVKTIKLREMINIIGFLFIYPAFSFGHPKAGGKTVYYYEPEISVLKGTLALETFPGSPEYSSIQEGDKPESYWVLKLDAPITVSSKNGNDEEGLYPVEKKVRVLQLAMDFDKVTPTKLGLKKGAKFQMVGTLFHRTTIHHVSRVLMWVQNAKPLK